MVDESSAEVSSWRKSQARGADAGEGGRTVKFGAEDSEMMLSAAMRDTAGNEEG